MNRILAIVLLAAAVAQARFIPEIQDSYVRYPALLKAANFHVQAKDRSEKIVGGKPVAVGQIPYQCNLQLRVGLQSYFCGCSIISPSVILTAAHCPDGASSITVTVADNRRNATDPDEKSMTALSWKVHERWDENNIENDIAIVIVDDLTFGDNINCIQLATEAEGDSLVGQIATISGWGKTSDTGSVSNQLNYAEVPIITNAECKSFFNIVTDKNICTSTNNPANTGTCGGDSGGPLTYDKRQIGIVSFGSGISCANTRAPSAFTRVSSFRQWVLDNAGTLPASC